MTTDPSEYFCSQKFTWLSIDLEKLETQSCCAATPEKINFNHIKNSPGDLFNSPALLKERQDMLNNIPVPSCDITCWQPESKSMPSRRLLMNSNIRTHNLAESFVESLNIITGSDCNMSCLYCCKTYSSAWARDLDTNGSYTIETNDDRYTLSPRDKVIMDLSQKQIKNGQLHKQLIDEIQSICDQPGVTEIVITGGEPFLYLGLEDLISKIPTKINTIKIWSGLGVDPVRFEKELKKLSRFTAIEIVISAEATEKLYELLRYGNTWKRFQQNIKILESQSVKHSFYATVTNLSLFGIHDFLLYIGSKEIVYSLCTYPEFLCVNVLDPDSKQKIATHLGEYPVQLNSLLTKKLFENPGNNHQKLKIYLEEFVNRRKIDVDFLPNEFRKWLT